MTYVDPARVTAAKDHFRRDQAGKGISVDAQGMTNKGDGMARADDPFFRLNDGSTWFDENVARNQHQGTSADPVMATNKRIAAQVRDDTDHWLGKMKEIQAEGFKQQSHLHNMAFMGQAMVRAMG